MNNLSYYKELQGVMTQFEPLTEAALQKVDADGLTIPEIRNALEKHGLDTTSARIWTDWIVFGSTAWTTAICVQIMAGACRW